MYLRMDQFGAMDDQGNFVFNAEPEPTAEQVVDIATQAFPKAALADIRLKVIRASSKIQARIALVSAKGVHEYDHNDTIDMEELPEEAKTHLSHTSYRDIRVGIRANGNTRHARLALYVP